MTTLTYTSPPEIAKAVRKAADQWNSVLRDLVALRPSNGYDTPQIIVIWGKIDRKKFSIDCTSECRHLGVDSWLILLSDEERWAISWWQRLTGRGLNVLSAMMHEFGHVFSLPHASDPSFVMHHQIPDVNALSAKEKSLYRGKFLRELEDVGD